MRQVAAHACVSLKTVSRVINAESVVSPTLRSRVQASIDHLGYRHNWQASSLKRIDSMSATIGCVLPDADNPVTATLSHEVPKLALLLGGLTYSLIADSLDAPDN